MSKININFKNKFRLDNKIYVANEEPFISQLTMPKDEILDFKYIDDNGNITPMILIPEEEQIEKIHFLLDKLSLLYESISNKTIAFDMACGKSSYDSQRAANDRVDKFQNIVDQIYDILYNKE